MNTVNKYEIIFTPYLTIIGWLGWGTWLNMSSSSSVSGGGGLGGGYSPGSGGLGGGWSGKSNQLQKTIQKLWQLITSTL